MDASREPDTPPDWARWTVVAITVATAAFCLPALAAEEPWFDETFSIVLASQDLPELWRRTLADQTNPPGFYLLLWGWTRLGGFDLAWMRLLPALAAVLTVPVVAMTARAAGRGWTAACVAAALAATSPLLLAMRSELRAYAILALGTALVLLAVARGRRPLAAAGLAALALLHYFGAFVAVAVAAGLLMSGRGRVRARLRAAAGLVLPAAAALGLWLLAVVAAAEGRPLGRNAAWIRPRYGDDLLSFGSQVVGTFDTRAGALLVAAFLLVALVTALREPAPVTHGSPAAVPAGTPPDADAHDLVWPWHVVVTSAWLPLLLVPLASAVTGRPLWVARYLIITLPAWWILAASLVAQAPQRWRTAALAAAVGWAALAGPLAERARPRRTAWSRVALALTAGGPRTICVNEEFVGLPLRYQALTQRIPLEVRAVDACTADGAADAFLLRPGTAGALEPLRRAGARVGPGRDLGTALPATTLHTLDWPRD